MRLTATAESVWEELRRRGVTTLGYPMTWQRLINRNGLGDGDYDREPESWRGRSQRLPYVADLFTPKERQLLDQKNADREQVGVAMRLLAGDLRRLEQDAVDERAIARFVAQRTHLELDVVAAVLKEFMAL